MIQIRLLAAALVLTCSQAIYASPADLNGGDAAGRSGAFEWLRAMSHAMQAVNYRGLLQHQQEQNDPSIFQVTHGTLGGKRYERLVYLGSRYREMMRHGADLTFVLVAGDPFLQQLSNPGAPELFNKPFARAFDRLPEEYYQATLGRTSRLAKRAVIEIAVTPKDNHRYGYRFWLDKESALLLRFEVTGPEHRTLESFSYVDIEIDVALGSEDLEVQVGAGHIKLQMKADQTKAVAQNHQPAPNWDVTWLPEGFSLVTQHSRRSAQNKEMLHSLSYSDGLAAFSIYIESLPEAVTARAPITTDYVGRLGSTVTVIGQTEGHARMPYMVMVVGEIPEKTAAQVVHAVGYRDSLSLRDLSAPAAAPEINAKSPVGGDRSGLKKRDLQITNHVRPAPR